jgi:DNA-binding PadR family transcriptional regulator
MKMISSAELIIISALAQEPAHASSLATQLEKKVGVKVGLSKNATDTKLRRMEGKKLLCSKWGKVRGGRRRVYTPTRTGEKALIAFFEAMRGALM